MSTERNLSNKIARQWTKLPFLIETASKSDRNALDILQMQLEHNGAKFEKDGLYWEEKKVRLYPLCAIQTSLSFFYERLHEADTAYNITFIHD